ncbi:MAG: DUF3892 domain-containing protein [Candidatus Aegiribacteria sp.]|nr:DUF3892 domain-containing protein [Candidatus Aegiribacteria sp.]
MGEWADYCIVAVRYGMSHSEITDVKIRKDLPDCFGKPETWTKEKTIQQIRNFFREIITMTQNGDNFEKGAKVRAVRVDNEYYLRTDGNETKEDNLGELPEF